MPDGCVWYSFGSDKTGPALAEALGFQASRKTPPFGDYKVVVGWGCKPGKNYSGETLSGLIREGKTRILNHPEMVDRNRNKLATLRYLESAGVAVPGFLEFEPHRPKVCSKTLIPDKLEGGQLSFPLILLNEFNKGEPTFCYTIEDVEAALQGNTRKKHPYNYVRSYDPGDEYRIHVFRDTVLFAQKKNLDEDPIAAITASLEKKYVKKMEKAGESITQQSCSLVRNVCRMLASEILASTHQLKKSVKMGWKLIDWELDLVPPAVMGIAVEALDAIHLDMGAVSVSNVDGTPRVLSATTAPALTPEQMAQYVVEVESFTNTEGKARAKKPELTPRRERRASPELVAKLYRKLKGLSAEKVEEVLGSMEE